MIEKYAIGADIGGSHIGCALVDMQRGKILHDSRIDVKVDSTKKAEVILNGWTEALQKVAKTIQKENLVGIGIAMPGPFDYEKGIAVSDREIKFKSLNGINIANTLRERLELDSKFPIRFINDATSFAVGEDWLGEAADAKRSIAITLGTGFGAAFIANGVPVVDGDEVPNGGCLWYLHFKDGIADEYFSTGWFVKKWEELTGVKIKGAKTIAELAPTALKAKVLFEQFGTNLGEFLSTWVSRFKGEKIVLGGNISGAYSFFKDSLETSLRKNKCTPAIAISGLKEDAAIIGAAKLIDDAFYEKVKPLLSKM